MCASSWKTNRQLPPAWNYSYICSQTLASSLFMSRLWKHWVATRGVELQLEAVASQIGTAVPHYASLKWLGDQSFCWSTKKERNGTNHLSQWFPTCGPQRIANEISDLTRRLRLNIPKLPKCFSDVPLIFALFLVVLKIIQMKHVEKKSIETNDRGSCVPHCIALRYLKVGNHWWFRLKRKYISRTSP